MEFWTLNLVVEVDDDQSLLTPLVCVGGGSSFAWGCVRVSLVDGDAGVQGVVRRALRPQDIGIELRLPALPPPEGVPVEDALGWGWDVAVETDGLERIRWRRYLEVGARVGPEGEIRLAGPPEDLRSKAEDEGWGPEAPWDARDSERLLADLVWSGILSGAERKAVLAEAASSGNTAERVLVERGHLPERELLERYAEVTGCELFDLDDYPIDPEAAAVIPEVVARHCGLLAIGYHGEMLTIAMSDPQNLDVVRALEGFAGRPYIALATRSDVLRALDRLARD